MDDGRASPILFLSLAAGVHGVVFLDGVLTFSQKKFGVWAARCMSGEEILARAESVVKRTLRPDLQEDAKQEFALGAWLASTRAKEGQAVREYQHQYGRGFMLRFLRNEIDGRKRERVSLSQDLSGEDDAGTLADRLPIGGEAPTERPEANDTRAWLCDLLRELPPITAAIVYARFFLGASWAEIGADLGITGEAVRVRAEDALAKLRRLIRRRKAPGAPAPDLPEEA